MKQPPPILIGIGSNEEPERSLQRAELALRAAFGELRMSPILRSKPLDGRGPDYLNAVALSHSTLSPAEIVRLLKNIENKLGRQRQQAPQAIARVVIDLDLLIVGDLCDAALKLPSPDLVERPFCLIPAAKLLPDWRHPQHRATLRQLAKQATSAGGTKT